MRCKDCERAQEGDPRVNICGNCGGGCVAIATPKTRIRIDIVISGDAQAAIEAIDRALDAGTIQDAIVAFADDDDAPDQTWDIKNASSRFADRPGSKRTAKVAA